MSKKGLFLFDLSFSLITELKTSYPCEDPSTSEAMFLDDNNIVSKCGGDTYTIYISTGICKFLSKGNPMCVSNNGEYLLVKAGVDKRKNFLGRYIIESDYRIIEITTRRSIQISLEGNSTIFSNTFSPNDQRLALIVRRWSWTKLDDVFYLLIFDIASGGLCETGVASKGGFDILWLD